MTPLPAAAQRSLFAGLFGSIAEEMMAVLVRTAYSPNIKERRDCSTALFDPAGHLVAQAAAIPVHLGALPLSVAAARAAFPDLGAGDRVLLNDPFRGGTHLPDLTIVSALIGPEGGPLAYLATRAHHADVGGVTAGSLPLAREIHQEGLRIPPVRLVTGGRRNDDLWELLLANVRTPVERSGDLRAQMGAHAIGEARLGETLARHGAETVQDRMVDLLDYGERLMRATVAAIPDGSYRFEDALDGDGIHPGPIPIRVAITIEGSDARIDFEGSAPACAGGLNAVLAVTRAAVDYCFLCLMTTPGRGEREDIPINAGCFRPLRVIAPPGSIVNAGPPHAVAAGNVETAQRIVDVVLGALAVALPERIPAASQGTMNNLTLGGHDPQSGAPFAYYETIAGGMGGRPGSPGPDGVHSHMTNTRNTPVEALELAYPLRVERYAIRRGSGGRGVHRGGHGLRRDIRALVPVEGTLLAERRIFRPYGLQGGEPGRAGRDCTIREGRAKTLPGKSLLRLEAGDVLSMRTPGGGGWGKAGGDPVRTRSGSPPGTRPRTAPA